VVQNRRLNIGVIGNRSLRGLQDLLLAVHGYSR
jgi:hypothetical protein